MPFKKRFALANFRAIKKIEELQNVSQCLRLNSAELYFYE